MQRIRPRDIKFQKSQPCPRTSHLMHLPYSSSRLSRPYLLTRGHKRQGLGVHPIRCPSPSANPPERIDCRGASASRASQGATPKAKVTSHLQARLKAAVCASRFLDAIEGGVSALGRPLRCAQPVSRGWGRSEGVCGGQRTRTREAAGTNPNRTASGQQACPTCRRVGSGSRKGRSRWLPVPC